MACCHTFFCCGNRHVLKEDHSPLRDPSAERNMYVFSSGGELDPVSLEVVTLLYCRLKGMRDNSSKIIKIVVCE